MGGGAWNRIRTCQIETSRTLIALSELVVKTAIMGVEFKHGQGVIEALTCSQREGIRQYVAYVSSLRAQDRSQLCHRDGFVASITM